MELRIDTNYKFYSDANGGDPDSTSKTLRNYHKILWNKTLPNGIMFELTDQKKGKYLYHNSHLGEFTLGSDAISHSYRNQKKKQWLIGEIPEQANELFEQGSTIGGYIIFPKNKIYNKFTINQARGINNFIDDRFDLTLESIRLFYLGKSSPLYETLLRYESFFKLFETFSNYVEFFLLDDLIEEGQFVKFFLPHDNFKTKPRFRNVEDYLVYKNNSINFIQQRNARINKYIETL